MSPWFNSQTKRCHENIKASLEAGIETRILVFTPITHLRYGDYEIDLAAGLEVSLIKALDPPWNGRDDRRPDLPITEDAEREKAEEPEEPEEPEVEVADIPPAPTTYDLFKASFQITLKSTYYDKGYINPGAGVSKHLGKHGDHVVIHFTDGSEPVSSFINRTANMNESVRVVGRNRQIAEWFQANFSIEDSVYGRVIDASTILLSPSRD